MILQHHASTGVLLANPQPMYAPIQVQRPLFMPPYYMAQQLLQHPSQPLAVPLFQQKTLLQQQHFSPQHPPQPQFPANAPLNLEQHHIFHARLNLGILADPAASHPGFSVKAKIIGPQGQNLKHILAVTGVEVHLKGPGTTNSPSSSGTEYLFLELSAPSQQSLSKAVELASNLLETVRLEHAASVTQPLQSYASKTPLSTQQLYHYNSQPVAATDPGTLQSRGRVPDWVVPASVIRSLQPNKHSNAPPNLQIAPNPLQSNASYSAPNISVQSGRCVPFIYSDGDGVVRPPTLPTDSVQIPASAIPQRSLATIEGVGRPAPALLSLNGSTFVAKAIVKDEDRQKKESNHDNRQSSSSSSSSSNSSGKRRRGFQESAVYTAPIDCPLPVATILESSTPPLRRPFQDSALARKHTATAGDAMVDGLALFSSAASSAVGENISKHATSDKLSVPEVSDPAPSVMAALAAMTERRLQAKILRPLVPSFSSSDSFAARSLSEKPSTEPQSVSHIAKLSPSQPPLMPSSTTSFTPPADDVTESAPPAAMCMKLPGLTAYEDDEDD